MLYDEEECIYLNFQYEDTTAYIYAGGQGGAANSGKASGGCPADRDHPREDGPAHLVQCQQRGHGMLCLGGQ